MSVRNIYTYFTYITLLFFYNLIIILNYIFSSKFSYLDQLTYIYLFFKAINLRNYLNYKPSFLIMEKGVKKFRALIFLYLIMYIFITYIDNILNS